MGEIAIMDYITGEIWLYSLPHSNMSNTEVEEFIKSMYFRLSDVNWMHWDSSIKIFDERANLRHSNNK